ncbi:MAG: alpha/beta-type small acid-soluble spore protein [Christensenellaceae bacterium]|nr:alpha/beta-type small acid-soluble spore protein [Christensenellaceae bacterium]
MAKSGNKAAVPEAKAFLDRMKYEVASEQGINLKEGYNGDLTAKENGTVGGYMVKKMIEQYQNR